MNLDKCGYPFYIRLNGLTSEIISFHGNWCKSIWVTYPLLEIEIIKDWRPVTEPQGVIALAQKRQDIIVAAKNRLLNIDDDNWDCIPF